MLETTQEKVSELISEVANVSDIIRGYVTIIDSSEMDAKTSDIMANGLVGVLQHLTRIAHDLEEVELQIEHEIQRR